MVLWFWDILEGMLELARCTANWQLIREVLFLMYFIWSRIATFPSAYSLYVFVCWFFSSTFWFSRNGVQGHPLAFLFSFWSVLHEINIPT